MACLAEAKQNYVSLVSAFDLIKLVGDQKNPKSTWERIKNDYYEIVANCDYSQFGKTKKTPVLNAKGVVMVLQLIPGRIAAQFRIQCGDIIVRYLGGEFKNLKSVAHFNFSKFNLKLSLIQYYDRHSSR
ncbi:MAG: hypothetical protein PHX34_04485 [Candidatus Shapirobacteria bacterium]|nr:hypothetical protein [Candidatus Shapirobacteria bacterium]